LQITCLSFSLIFIFSAFYNIDFKVFFVFLVGNLEACGGRFRGLRWAI